MTNEYQWIQISSPQGRCEWITGELVRGRGTAIKARLGRSPSISSLIQLQL